MQYATMQIFDDKQILLDANELISIHSAWELEAPSSTYVKEHTPDDSKLTLIIVYGVYMPQVNFDFPFSEKKLHMLDSMNQWLVHLDNDKCNYLGIEEIHIYDEPILTTCGHKGCGTKLHKSPNVAFSALIGIPAGFKIGDMKSQAKTAYLRHFKQMDVLTDLINRMGVFAFKAQEKRIPKKTVLTKDNWLQFVNHPRAFLAAQKTK